MRKFSMIVPIYNVKEYLPQCVNSLINQTYSDIEIVLVDDGSTDGCATLCDEFAALDRRIKVVHKKNGGLVSARKAGAEIATGDYICCVDGDDYVADSYVSEFDKVLEYGAYDILCCGFYLAMKDKTAEKKLPYRYGEYTRKDIETDIFSILIQSCKAEHFLPSVWGKAIKREMYLPKQLSVPDGISMGEDGAVTIPIVAEAKSMYIMEECLYYYRYNPLSLTKIKKPLSWEGQLAVINYLYSVLPLDKADFEQQMFRRVVHGFFNVAKSQFNRKEPYKKIKKEILEYMEYPVFKEAIEHSKFSGSVKANMMDYSLKKKKIYLLYLFNKMR